jgi:hypothetical protein
MLPRNVIALLHRPVTPYSGVSHSVSCTVLWKRVPLILPYFPVRYSNNCAEAHGITVTDLNIIQEMLEKLFQQLLGIVNTVKPGKMALWITTTEFRNNL